MILKGAPSAEELENNRKETVNLVLADLVAIGSKYLAMVTIGRVRHSPYLVI